MNTDTNQMLRRLVGLRLLMNRPLTADDPPISFDDGTAAPGAPYNPWTPEDQLKQLVARTRLTGRPPSVDEIPRASLQAPAATAVSRSGVPPSTNAAPQTTPANGAGPATNSQSPGTGFRWRDSAIYDYPDQSEDVAEGGTVAWRTNNPGNMHYGPFAKAHGAIGNYGDFAIFPDEATGSAALDVLLNRNDFQAGTIDDAIANFAPKKDNNTAAYQAFVAKRLNLPGSTPMASLSPVQMRTLPDAIRTYEGWRTGNRRHLQAR
jgi:hypothetical protein